MSKEDWDDWFRRWWQRDQWGPFDPSQAEHLAIEQRWDDTQRRRERMEADYRRRLQAETRAVLHDFSHTTIPSSRITD